MEILQFSLMVVFVLIALFYLGIELYKNFDDGRYDQIIMKFRKK